MDDDSPTESDPSTGRWPTDDDLETRRLALFLALAFGISWATALLVYLTGGLVDSPELVPGVTLALILLALPYMWGPAIAHVFTRLLTGEGFGWNRTFLHPQIRHGWPYWIAAWLAPVGLIVLGAAVWFAVFPAQFGGLDAVAEMLAEAEAEAGQEIPLSPAVFVLIQLVAVLALAPLVNSFSAFGEEFGWRAYLLPKLAPLGLRRALLVHGIIWGVWHWPVIAMGHNYGVEYPGFPWAGMGTFLVSTVAMGTFLGWLTLRSGSVWPATIGHAVINGSAGLALIFAYDIPNQVIGPTPAGLVGILPWIVVAAALLAKPEWLGPVEPPSLLGVDTEPDEESNEATSA